MRFLKSFFNKPKDQVIKIQLVKDLLLDLEDNGYIFKMVSGSFVISHPIDDAFDKDFVINNLKTISKFLSTNMDIKSKIVRPSTAMGGDYARVFRINHGDFICFKIYADVDTSNMPPHIEEWIDNFLKKN